MAYNHGVFDDDRDADILAGLFGGNDDSEDDSKTDIDASESDQSDSDASDSDQSDSDEDSKSDSDDESDDGVEDIESDDSDGEDVPDAINNMNIVDLANKNIEFDMHKHAGNVGVNEQYVYELLNKNEVQKIFSYMTSVYQDPKTANIELFKLYYQYIMERFPLLGRHQDFAMENIDRIHNIGTLNPYIMAMSLGSMVVRNNKLRVNRSYYKNLILESKEMFGNFISADAIRYFRMWATLYSETH